MFRRLLPLLLALTTVAIACGSSDPVETTADDDTPEVTTADDDTTAFDSEPVDETTEDLGTKPEVAVPTGPAPTSLVTTDIVEGEGRAAAAGDFLEMHYVGVRYSDGGQFDASWDRGTTFNFVLGAGNVIRGWDEGIVGMQVGGRRQLTIPAELAYGEASPSPDIPANSPLVFVVDLLSATSEPSVAQEPEPVDELVVTVLDEGDGVEIEDGMVVELLYVAKNQANDEVFDSSWLNGRPASFILGAEPIQSIPAWEDALPGQKVGSTLRLVIPAGMGVEGVEGGVVGPDDTIITEVIVLKAG